jgi:aerobic-type carbon monoxide dehydrogenase small subunit (CoxS/CutS family)
MILAAKAFLDEKLRDRRDEKAAEPRQITDAEIIEHMNGNLCRCTGYLPILKAIRQAVTQLQRLGEQS